MSFNLAFLQLYALIDEPSLRKIKSEVADAIEPQIEKLVAQGEKAITNLEKTSASLQRKASMSHCYDAKLKCTDRSATS